MTKARATKPCIFCSIIEGKEKGYVVYEDELTIAILDIHPVFEGHVLLMPKQHIELFMEVTPALGAVLFNHTQLMAKAIQAAYGCEGIFIANNNVVSQSVPHMHMHIVPRNKKDGLHGFFFPRHPYRDEEHLEETKKKLMDAIKQLQSFAGVYSTKSGAQDDN